MALAGLAVDPDVVPEAAALPERLGAHRAREVAISIGVRQALVAFVGPKSDLLVILWFEMHIYCTGPAVFEIKMHHNNRLWYLLTGSNHIFCYSFNM